ncbi:MAG: DUF2059 domain-containing protein [Kiritimatiellaeota bacterium]|nr:DUF2059 domain-containing protein [Kiritimatiellota bacterium]
MKKKMMFVIGAMLCLVSGAFAQEIDAARRAAATELLTTMKIKESVDQTLDLMAEQMTAMIPGTDAKMMDKIMSVLKEAIGWDNMKDKYVAMYANAFTVEELKAANAFFKTPAGQAFITKQPELMKQGMEIGQKAARDAMPKIQAIMQE